MTIPSYIVVPEVLGMFSKARERGVEPAELLVLMVISMASPGEAVTVDHLKLLTGGERTELLASVKRLKTEGFLEQLGVHFPMTRRGKDLMREVSGL